jgi:hypothetical protein
MYTTTKYIHNKRVARVTSPLPHSSFSSPPPPPPLSPGLGAAWKNLRTDHLTQPKHARSKPALQVNRRLLESVTVRRYKGGPGRSPGQARAGNITALLSHANTSEQAPAWPGVVAAALGRRRSTTPRIISSEGAKRVAQARGTQDASWGS